MNSTEHNPKIMGYHPYQFTLERLVDSTGVSGVGRVAEGIVFSDGSTVMRWLTEHRSTTFYESAREVLAIHGHGGATELRYHVANLPRFDGRACSNCAHPWGAHDGDGANICCAGGCTCCLMENPEFVPLGILVRGT